MKTWIQKTAFFIAFLLTLSLFGGLFAAAAPLSEQPVQQSQSQAAVPGDNYAAAAKQKAANQQGGETAEAGERPPSYKEGEVLVTFRHTLTQKGADAVLESYDTESLETTKVNGEFNVVEVPEGEEVAGFLNKLEKNPAVLHAQPNYRYFSADAGYVPDTMTNDQWLQRQWYLDAVGAYGAWKTTKGVGVKVAVLDTGVRIVNGKATHPDLTNRVEKAYGLVNNNQDMAVASSMVDKRGHGTHVAGIIAAQGNNKIGISGVAPSASLLVMKVEDNDESIFTSYVVLGIRQAMEQGAKVINMSFNSKDGNYDYALEQAVNSAYASGIVNVASAGNDSTTAATYPSDFANCISVTAVDEALFPSWYSNGGSAKDLAAPGDSIYSTIPATRYDYLNGTSMAAPIVAATAALMQTARKSSGQAYLSPASVKSILQATALKMGTGGSNSNQYGAGVVDTNAAVQRAKFGTNSTNTTLAAVYAQGTDISYVSTLQNGDRNPYIHIEDSYVRSINLKAIPASSGSSVSGGGTKSLKLGNNQFTITVTAQNGAKRNYSVTVYVGETDSILRYLTVMDGTTGRQYDLTPSFSSERLNYSLSLPYNVKGVRIAAGSTGMFSNIESEDLTDEHDENDSFFGVKALAVGRNEVRLKVTAQNGELFTYTLTINRAAPSTDNNLSGIRIVNAATNYPYTLSPVFRSSTTSYTLHVKASLHTLHIQATKSSQHAEVSGTGNWALAMGSNKINLAVTAENGAVKTYTITVYRGDTDYMLSSIKATNAKTGYPYSLAPAFKPSVARYNIDVPATVEKLNIQAVASSSKATVTGAGEVTLAYGKNEFRVICRAQNGRARTYFLTVNRSAPSTNNNLSALNLFNAATNYPYSVSPAFSPSTTNYTLQVKASLHSLRIQPVRSHKYASVTGSGIKTLEYGENQFDIVVTAQSGAVKTYTLKVMRALAPGA
ncbi:MAG: S8 family serine peptidase [Christensenellales bacterium]|jgi:thermitase